MRTAIRTGLRVLPAVALLVAGCATTGPAVHSRMDPGADLGRYATFGFMDEMPGHEPPYRSFVAQQVKEAIARELRARGYRQDPNAELMVNFHVATRDQVQVTQTPVARGYYGYRRGLYGWGPATAYATDVHSYREGTLNIDVVDAAARRLLWEGIAVGRIRQSDRENPGPAVDAAVAQIFAEFPGRR